MNNIDLQLKKTSKVYRQIFGILKMRLAIVKI